MDFEWDEKKAVANRDKHRVFFEDAIAIFDDEDAVSSKAKTVDGELRFKRTGLAADALLTIIYVWRKTGDGEIARIISARPASRKERQTYGDHTLRAQTPDA